MLSLSSSQFFETLPVYIKESIMQSGIGFENEEELRTFASSIEQER